MLLKRLNWIGLSLLLGSLPLHAAALQQDAGPLPPPDGPFFSSKPLLYFGEEPSVNPIQLPSNIPGSSVGGYPNHDISAPFGFGRMPFQQMAPSPQGWGAQRPYYPNFQRYPTYPVQQGYPNSRGYPAYPPFSGQGGR